MYYVALPYMYMMKYIQQQQKQQHQQQLQQQIHGSISFITNHIFSFDVKSTNRFFDEEKATQAWHFLFVIHGMASNWSRMLVNCRIMKGSTYAWQRSTIF